VKDSLSCGHFYFIDDLGQLAALVIIQQLKDLDLRE
jgi:hypothetical protein